MTVSYDFKGKIAVVTGGDNGIGKEAARRLDDAGATVAVWDRAAPMSAGVLHMRVDVSDPSSIAAALHALITKHGTVDMLVHSAGYVGPTLPLADYDPAEWRRLINVNLVGTYEVCRQIVPVMQRRGAGRIVNVASLAGKEGTPNSSAYSAAKAGVIALTKSLGKELALTGIRVNCIAPAAVETGLLAQVTPEHLQIMIDKSPMKRLGTVQECAELILWLCSEACTFSTGAVFDLSGGRATY
jgi:2-dehydro-3-deoxy-L-rhamnonate dehydrogenase (NAD+)